MSTPGGAIVMKGARAVTVCGVCASELPKGQALVEHYKAEHPEQVRKTDWGPLLTIAERDKLRAS